MTNLAPGSVVDKRFELEKTIGAGGAGTVWLGTDLHKKERVAIKLLHPRLWEERLALNRFRREGELLMELKHLHIASAVGFRASGEHPYLALEYVEGTPLSNALGVRAPRDDYFDSNTLLRMFTEICAAVHYAHQQGVVHRDLKPTNIMIEPSGAIKVLDFGVARLVDQAADKATTQGRMVGSFFYMSPEQTRGEPAGIKSDVYALGVNLFEMLTLRRCWALDEHGLHAQAYTDPIKLTRMNAPDKLLTRIETEDRPLPSDTRSDLSPGFDRVCERAMAIAIEERYDHVEALLHDVRCLFTGDATLITMGQTALIASDFGVTEANEEHLPAIDADPGQEISTEGDQAHVGLYAATMGEDDLRTKATMPRRAQTVEREPLAEPSEVFTRADAKTEVKTNIDEDTYAVDTRAMPMNYTEADALAVTTPSPAAFPTPPHILTPTGMVVPQRSNRMMFGVALALVALAVVLSATFLSQRNRPEHVPMTPPVTPVVPVEPEVPTATVEPRSVSTPEEAKTDVKPTVPTHRATVKKAVPVVEKAPVEKKKQFSHLDSLLNQVKKSPEDIDKMERLSRELIRAADTLADRKVATTIRRKATTSRMVGDLSGFEQAVRAVQAAAEK